MSNTTIDYNEMWNSIAGPLAEKDALLDSWDDSAGAGKRKISNDLVEARKDSWEPNATQLIQALSAVEGDDEFAGSYLGLMRALKSALDERANAIVQAKFDAQPKNETPDVDQDEKKKVAEERKGLYENLKQLHEMLIGWNVIDENDPAYQLPKNRRTNVGPRGKRALSFADWTVDGVELDDENNNTRGAATAAGYEKIGEFTKALRDAGADTSSTKDFSVEVNGHKVEAIFPEDTEVVEESPTEESE